MAGKFQITIKRRKGCLYLRPIGNLDGSSAMQLLYQIRRFCRTAPCVLVDTSDLIRIEPFGLNVFRYNIGSLRENSTVVRFMGKHAEVLSNVWA